MLQSLKREEPDGRESSHETVKKRTRRYMEVIAPAKVREGQKNLAKKRRYANRHG